MNGKIMKNKRKTFTLYSRMLYVHIYAGAQRQAGRLEEGKQTAK